MGLVTNLKIRLSLLFSFVCLVTGCALAVLEIPHYPTIIVVASFISLSITTFMLFRLERQQNSALLQHLRFVSLAENSSDVIGISGPDRKIKYLNSAARRILGIDEAAKLEELRSPQFYTPEGNKFIETDVLPTMREKGHWTGEINYKNIKTNESIPVHMKIFGLKDPTTDKQIGFATVSRDLRETKSLERMVDRFFEVSLDMMAVANLDGYFLRINPAFTETLGWTQEEFCSRPCTDFIHPEDISKTIAELEKQSNGLAVKSFENRYRTKKGDYRWLSWKSYPDGQLTYGAARDITDEKDKKALMEKLSQDAIEASRAKSEFLANMSHEIRTPINGVVGMTTLLLNTALSEEQFDYAESVRLSANSLLTIINDILDFSKVEAGKLDLEIVDFSLDNLIEETTKNFSWTLKSKSLPLVVDYQRNANLVYRGDPGRIRQVLTNLLSNASKFTETGSIRLVIKTDPVTNSVHFSVIDTGIGISEEAKKKMFKAFSQADASMARKFGGSGLGLSICQKLVELMGGENGFESEEGKGSTFWFLLPLKLSASTQVVKEAKQEIKPSRFAGARILVAEDNTANQKIIMLVLQKLGFKSQCVANGNEVLALLKDSDFDLILMDCQMPVMDGYTATRKIRESQSMTQTNIPIVAMTANALKGDRETCLAAGMNDYTTKPVDVRQLSEILDRWLAAGISETKKVA